MTSAIPAPSRAVFPPQSRVRIGLAALGGVAGGAFYALVAYGAFRLHWLPEGVVSWSYILGVPFVIGVVCVGLSGRALQSDLVYCSLASWLSILLLYVGLALIKIETLICLIMLAPAALSFASLGGLVAGTVAWSLKRPRASRNIVGCLALAPLLFVRIEVQQSIPEEIRTVTDRVVIAAPPQRVWDELLNVPDIRPGELRWSFSHAIGLPRPRAALLSGSGVGAVRDLYWEGDVHFREYVTAWEPARRLAYRVDVAPAREALQRLDTHVVIGDRYFDIRQGEYVLRDLGDGSTELTLSTTYRMRTLINVYGGWWADRTLDDFHTVVLQLLKQRIEAAG